MDNKRQKRIEAVIAPHLPATDPVAGRETPVRVTEAQAIATPIPAGQRSALMMSHGSMQVKYYAPRGIDEQSPHSQDELYVVIRGTGSFLCGERRHPFGPGDVLFAPAGVHHRFEDFSDDFGVWVIFYGPEGGEKPR